MQRHIYIYDLNILHRTNCISYYNTVMSILLLCNEEKKWHRREEKTSKMGGLN